MLKILQARLQEYVNLQMLKLDLEKAEAPEIKFPTSVVSSKQQESSRNIYFCFIDYVGEDSWESLGLQGDPTSPS